MVGRVELSRDDMAALAQESFLSGSQASERIGITKDLLRKWKERGKIAAVMIGETPIYHTYDVSQKKHEHELQRPHDKGRGPARDQP